MKLQTIGAVKPPRLPSFAAPKVAIAKPVKIPAAKAVQPVKVSPVKENWAGEVKQETRRLTGVTPKLTKAYQESPARWLPRAKSGPKLRKSGALNALAGGV